RSYLGAGAADGASGAASAGGGFAIALLLLRITMFSGGAFAAARGGQPALLRGVADSGNTAIQAGQFGVGPCLVDLAPGRGCPGRARPADSWRAGPRGSASSPSRWFS